MENGTSTSKIPAPSILLFLALFITTLYLLWRAFRNDESVQDFLQTSRGEQFRQTQQPQLQPQQQQQQRGWYLSRASALLLIQRLKSQDAGLEV